MNINEIVLFPSIKGFKLVEDLDLFKLMSINKLFKN